MDHIPDIEHLPAPKTPFDVLADELRRFPNKNSFGHRIAMIERVNESTPLRESLEAHVMFPSGLEEMRGGEVSPDAGTMFYAGALVGMHCATSTMHPAESNSVMYKTIDVATQYQQYPGESTDAGLTRLIDLFQISAELAEQSFHNLAPRHQELLIDAALYAGEDFEPDARFSFVQGFIFAAENTLRLANEGVDAA